MSSGALFSGPRSPKRFNLFNEILVNELAQLRAGLVIYDRFKPQRELIKVGILYMVSGIPGLTKEQNH